MQILWFVVVGPVAGWATGKIIKGSGDGALMDIVFGIVGAVLGGFLMRAMGHFGEGGLLYSIVVAAGGAAVLVALARFFSPKKKEQSAPGLESPALEE